MILDYYIFAIESTCDNSSVCLMDSKKNIYFYRNLNQEFMIDKYGGFIPHLMIDKHITNFLNIISDFVCNTNFLNKIKYIAIANGPGMSMSLNVGYHLALFLSCKFDAELIFVDHMESHIWSHTIESVSFKNVLHPFISIVATGGHFLISYVDSNQNVTILCKSVDDAPGEILDKISVKLDLPIKGGQGIDNMASIIHNDDNRVIKSLVNIQRSRARNIDKYYCSSFSGIKTRIINFIRNNTFDIHELCISIEYLIFLEIKHSIKYVLNYLKLNNLSFDYISCVGGVFANSYLRKKMIVCYNNIILADLKYCQDNACMIANLGLLCIKKNIKQSKLCKNILPYVDFIV